jgi:proteasome accessory factor C
VTISNAQTLQEVRSLTSDEIIVLLLGLDILRSALSDKDIETTSLIDSLRERATRIVGDIVSIDSNNSNEILSMTHDALVQRRELSFTYLSPVKDHISTRRVIPREIRTSSGTSYLEGFCRDSGAFRTFRIDRMTDLSLGEKSSPEKFERSEAVRDLAQIKITKNLRKSAEKLGVPLSDLDGAIGATTSIGYFDLEWLLRTTLSSLGSLEVIAPVQARRGVSERAQALLQAYKTGDVPL